MSDERRPKIDPSIDPDAPPSEEEVAASQKLRDALDDDPIAAALKAAWSPQPITAEAHQQILDDMPVSAEEMRLAALVDEDEMVAALRAAWNPSALPEAEHQRIVDRALAGAVVTVRPRSRLRVAVVTTTTVFALAAGVMLFLQTQDAAPKAPSIALVKARSTQPLFGDQPFELGETSARIDKIAVARQWDYRANYFAKRGVK